MGSATGSIATRVAVGPADAFPVGKFSRLDIPGKDIWLLRTPGGRFFAIRNVCPHRAAPICLGRVDGSFLPSEPGEFQLGPGYESVRCPHHNWEFDLESGLPVRIPGGRGRLTRYPVTVENGEVLVETKSM